MFPGLALGAWQRVLEYQALSWSCMPVHACALLHPSLAEGVQIYPLVLLQTCLTAALVLTALPKAIMRGLATILPRQASHMLARAVPALALAAVALMSAARVGAVLGYYRAPLQVYTALPEVGLHLTGGAMRWLSCRALLPHSSAGDLGIPSPCTFCQEASGGSHGRWCRSMRPSRWCAWGPSGIASHQPSSCLGQPTAWRSCHRALGACCRGHSIQARYSPKSAKLCDPQAMLGAHASDGAVRKKPTQQEADEASAT